MSVRTFDRVIFVVTIVVIAGIGLCLFHADDAAEGDSCPSYIGSMTALLVGIYLVPIARLLPAVALAYPLTAFDLPSPPPKT